MHPQTLCSCMQLLPLALALMATTPAQAAERTESFDREPNWEGHNHRAVEPAPREVRQDFGFSPTSHAGGQPGEIGGLVAAAGEPAYYALKIPEATLEQPLTASGNLACGDRPFHLLLGFFNAETTKEWRTPNTISMRLNGRGDIFYAYVEYATSQWRAGGDDPRGFPAARNKQTGRPELLGFAAKQRVHHWSLTYDPAGNDGGGTVKAVIDDQTAICNLAPGHKQDGATFNRFGILTVMKSADDRGELWLDDVEIQNQKFDFTTDPKWDGMHNRRTYTTNLVRPRFDFGFSPTQFAAGRGAGELGGTIFRGDCRYPERMAHFADRLAPLSLEKPLRASGKVSLRRAVSDSGVLIGFFDSHESTLSNPSQDSGLPKHFFGVSTDAPSRDGFYFSPTYRLAGDARAGSLSKAPLRLLPNGAAHDWTFVYDPLAGKHGQVTVTLDGRSVELPLAAGHKAAGTLLDRFGIVTPWVDGNSQDIYFDDLSYTWRQD